MGELEDEIRENLSKPKRAKGDQGEMEAHSLKDQVEAAKFLSSDTVAEKPHRALKYARIKPPGAV